MSALKFIFATYSCLQGRHEADPYIFQLLCCTIMKIVIYLFSKKRFLCLLVNFLCKLFSVCRLKQKNLGGIEMFIFANADILEELKKSNEQFANLFIKNEAIFVQLPQSGNSSQTDAGRYAAQVGDVTMLARYNVNTKTWKFHSFILGM